jgi:hypothetical protein
MPETVAAETVAAAGEGAPEGDEFDSDEEPEKAPTRCNEQLRACLAQLAGRGASIDWRQQDCSKNAAVWATVDVEAVFKSDLGIPQYPPLVLLQLDVLPFYELIIKSPAVALQQYRDGPGHLPHVAVSFLGRHASNAASEGRHSVAKLVMSDKQMAMSPTTFSQFAMLRGHTEQTVVAGYFSALKEIYKDEARHVAHDITAKL